MMATRARALAWGLVFAGSLTACRGGEQATMLASDGVTKITSSDSTDGSCARSTIKDGVGRLTQDMYSIALVKVTSIGTPELKEKGSRKSVFTPVTVEPVEQWRGDPVPTTVYFNGGIADGHETAMEAPDGLVSDATVVLSVVNARSLDAVRGPGPAAPGSLIVSSMPIDDNKVVVSDCWSTAPSEGEVAVPVDFERLDFSGKPEKVATSRSTIPPAQLKQLFMR